MHPGLQTFMTARAMCSMNTSSSVERSTASCEINGLRRVRTKENSILSNPRLSTTQNRGATQRRRTESKRGVAKFLARVKATGLLPDAQAADGRRE